MLHVGLDLSRHRVDVHLLAEDGTTLEVTTAPPDLDGLRGVEHQNLDRAECIQRGTSAFDPGNSQDLGAGSLRGESVTVTRDAPLANAVVIGA